VLWVNDLYGATFVCVSGWFILYDVIDDWMVAVCGFVEFCCVVDLDWYLVENVAVVIVCLFVFVVCKVDVCLVVLVINGVDVECYWCLVFCLVDLSAGLIVVYVGTLHVDWFDVGLCEEMVCVLDGIGMLVLVGLVALDCDDIDRFRCVGVVVFGVCLFYEVFGYL